MSLSLNNLPKIKKQSKKRLGRGIGSSKGKTSGRGVKGQKARTGHHSVKGFEGGQTPIYMRLPKKGFNNNLKKHIETVNIRDIENHIKKNNIESTEITKDILENIGLIKNKKSIVKLIMSSSKINDLKVKIIVDKYSKNSKSFS
jgi:large subunit ribosomal protein L15